MKRTGVESGRDSKREGRQIGRVIADYRSAYTMPWIMHAGDKLRIGEKESEWRGWIWCTNQMGQGRWVPEKYVDRKGEGGVALCEYQATELSVRVGEELLIGDEESGWLWCTNREGWSGWVPAKHVEKVPGHKRFQELGDSKCVFCHIDEERIIRANRLAYAIRDQFAVTPHHTLIIPRRHVSSYFDLDSSEIVACHRLLAEVEKGIVSSDSKVEGFNIGVNQGRVAGQTISHCHIHLIPRRAGDVDEPRGGIRHIIPGKGCYQIDTK